MMTNGNLGAEKAICAYIEQIVDAGEKIRVRNLHFKLKAKRTEECIASAKKNKEAKAEIKAINDQRQKDLAQGSTFNTTYYIVL